MTVKHLLVTAFVGLSFMLLSGCTRQTEEPTATPSPTVNSKIPQTVPETTQVQADICGGFTIDVVSQATGTKVAPPSVRTIESSSGAKRHVCTYFKDGDPATPIAYINVTFRKEGSSESFQQLWEGQKQSQENSMTPVTGIGTEAFMGVVDNQPVVYVLAPEAQYWIRMGKTTLSNERQTTIVQNIAKSANQ